MYVHVTVPHNILEEFINNHNLSAKKTLVDYMIKFNTLCEVNTLF